MSKKSDGQKEWFLRNKCKNKYLTQQNFSAKNVFATSQEQPSKKWKLLTFAMKPTNSKKKPWQDYNKQVRAVSTAKTI